MVLSFIEKQQRYIEQFIVKNNNANTSNNIGASLEGRNPYFGNYIVSQYQVI